MSQKIVSVSISTGEEWVEVLSRQKTEELIIGLEKRIDKLEANLLNKPLDPTLKSQRRSAKR